MAAAPSTVTLLAAESSPQEATVPAASSSYTACAAAAAVAAVIVPASSATSTPASPPAGGCGDGGFGGSTMAAAGRGGSSFKVDTRPCLREGEFPSRGVGAAPSPSLPLQPVRDQTGRGSPPPHPPTCCGAVKAKLAPPRRSSPECARWTEVERVFPTSPHTPEKDGGGVPRKRSCRYSQSRSLKGRKIPLSFSPNQGALVCSVKLRCDLVERRQGSGAVELEGQGKGRGTDGERGHR